MTTVAEPRPVQQQASPPQSKAPTTPVARKPRTAATPRATKLTSERLEAVRSGARRQAMDLAASTQYNATDINVPHETAWHFVNWLYDLDSEDKAFYVGNIIGARRAFAKSFKRFLTPEMFGLMKDLAGS